MYTTFNAKQWRCTCNCSRTLFRVSFRLRIFNWITANWLQKRFREGSQGSFLQILNSKSKWLQEAHVLQLVLIERADRRVYIHIKWHCSPSICTYVTLGSSTSQTYSNTALTQYKTLRIAKACCWSAHYPQRELSAPNLRWIYCITTSCNNTHTSKSHITRVS